MQKMCCIFDLTTIEHSYEKPLVSITLNKLQLIQHN